MKSSGLECEACLVHFNGIKCGSDLIKSKVCWSLSVIWWMW